MAVQELFYPGKVYEDLQYVSGGTVLIVEENVDLCLLMKTYLLRKDCRVFIAYTLADAIHQTTMVLPGVIIIVPSSENTVAVVNDFVALVPDIQLITCGQQVSYKK